ncbi:aminoglycoside N6'-acetyltransferase [Fictibacillus macauensis ZFHKF-1]|uniref:Aminoglycoside N6'-acetyltransferase n=1 Tax=Fictibacillus macauensis ZFHKF-1 TaxID=1196324 RepID=I8AGG3_9BACL|nr:GNAT family protein [Fictibacillus macauensis]EIT84469.1 aminoglycoside N6'-acetyltransferase [Fictibacillus macauensis ZFHKF-1]
MKLISKRLYLRELTEVDAPILLEGTRDQELRYMTGTKLNFTLEQIKAHIQHINHDESRYDFAICLKENDQMIGELSILDIDQENKKAGFRIALNSMALTGQGYGTEAIKVILPFVFEELQLNRLQLEVFDHNLRGITAYEKVGFVKEGVLRDSLNFEGKYADEIIMALLKKDYTQLTY